MEFRGERILPVSLDAAWHALNDTTLLRQAIPGCESIVPASAADGSLRSDLFDLVLVAAVGPVKARFEGSLELADLDPPHAYTLRVAGDGGVAGSARGAAAVRLAALDASTTTLAYDGTASVDGRIAWLGARFVDVAVRRIAAGFFDDFTALLERRGP